MRSVVRSLHTIGSVVEIKWFEYEGGGREGGRREGGEGEEEEREREGERERERDGKSDEEDVSETGEKEEESEREKMREREREKVKGNGSEATVTEKIYIIGQPKWLADLMRTVVTVRGSSVRHGFISRRQLYNLWSHYECDPNVLIQIMSQLDVMVRMENDADTFLIPCMLPETILPSEDDSADPSGSSSRELKRLHFRRSYLMEKGKAVPVGVIGKMIATAVRWGHYQNAWRDGCVVTQQGMWYLVRRQRVRILKKEYFGFEVSKGVSKDFGGAFVDAVHIIMSSLSRDRASSQRSFFLFRQWMTNILTEFFHVTHTEVIPRDDECSDWCAVKDVICALEKKMPLVTSHFGEQIRVDTLCGDLRVESSVTKFSASEIQIFEELGTGSFGTVRRGEVFLPDPGTDSVTKKGKESREYGDDLVSSAQSKRTGSSVIVAVKMFFDVEEMKRRNLRKIDGLSSFLSANWEIYLMSCLRHPNVIQLIGVCFERHPPWLVIEYVAGRDLFASLTDPTFLEGHLVKFSAAFYQRYNEHVFGDALGDGRLMDDLLKIEIENLRKSVEGVTEGRDAMRKCFEQLLECARVHWDEKSSKSNADFLDRKEEVQMINEISFSPFSLSIPHSLPLFLSLPSHTHPLSLSLSLR